MQLSSAAQTDIGLLRSENEDRLLCDDALRVYAVADGIGGLPGGAEAAATAIASLLQEAQAAGKALNLARAFDAVNEEVLRLADKLAPDTGLGTTLCALIITDHDKHLHLANVGDSRCYLFREGRLQQLTEDDTMENDVLRRRAKGENVMLEARYRNTLTRCIGQPMPLHIQVSRHALQSGDQLLICSDGISRQINDAGIVRRLRADLAPTAVLAALIADSLIAGGLDNATGVLVRINAI